MQNGISVDTSMGFTPLEGLVMGTRCGDIDPAIPLHVMESKRLSTTEMDRILNKESGLYGLTGGDSDMRTIEKKAARSSERHILALKIFAKRIKKYIGAYTAVMNGLDALVFTAGIGENSPEIRRLICEGLDYFGILIDDLKNKKNDRYIHGGTTPVMVIKTNEELSIARETVRVLSKEAVRVEA